MDVVRPEIGVVQPLPHRIPEQALGLRADEREPERLRVRLPDDAVDRGDELGHALAGGASGLLRLDAGGDVLDEQDDAPDGPCRVVPGLHFPAQPDGRSIGERHPLLLDSGGLARRGPVRAPPASRPACPGGRRSGSGPARIARPARRPRPSGGSPRGSASRGRTSPGFPARDPAGTAAARGCRAGCRPSGGPGPRCRARAPPWPDVWNGPPPEKNVSIWPNRASVDKAGRSGYRLAPVFVSLSALRLVHRLHHVGHAHHGAGRGAREQ